MAGSGRVRRTRPSGGLTHARLVSGLTCSHGHLGPPGVGQLLARAVLGVWCKKGGGVGGPGGLPTLSCPLPSSRPFSPGHLSPLSRRPRGGQGAGWGSSSSSRPFLR